VRESRQRLVDNASVLRPPHKRLPADESRRSGIGPGTAPGEEAAKGTFFGEQVEEVTRPPQFQNQAIQEAEALLTAGEAVVLRSALRGLTIRQIADELVLGQSTIKTHLAHIYAKLEVRGRIELLALLGSTAPTSGAGEVSANSPLGELALARRDEPGWRAKFVLISMAALVLTGLLGVALARSRTTLLTTVDLRALATHDQVRALELHGNSVVVSTNSASRLTLDHINPAEVQTIAVTNGIPLTVAPTSDGTPLEPVVALLLPALVGIYLAARRWSAMASV